MENECKSTNNQITEAPHIEELALNIEHLKHLEDRKLLRRESMFFTLFFPILAILSNLQDWETRIDFLLLVLAGALVFYIVLNGLLKIQIFKTWQLRLIFASHKHLDKDRYNSDMYFLGFSIVLTVIIAEILQSLEPLQTEQYMRTHLWIPIVVLCSTVALQQILGQRYPYAKAFYRLKMWFDGNIKRETPGVWLLIDAFENLEKHFVSDDLSFEEFYNKFLEGIIFLVRFGPPKYREEYCNDVATLLEAMQRLDSLQVHNYYTVLSIMDRMNKKLTKLDFRELIKRKLSWTERLKIHLQHPERYLIAVLLGLFASLYDYIRLILGM